MNQNQSQVWLISGASRGIGKAIAIHVAEHGGYVAAGVRKIADATDLTEKYPHKIIPVLLDVTDPAQVRESVRITLEKFGKIDVLINNAGYGLQGMVEEVTDEQIRDQMETNFFGLSDLTRVVIPQMRAQGSGYIVNISSVAGLRGAAALGYYNASKFAVEGFSEALAQEMKLFGVRVSVVEPGPYRTDWSGKSLIRSEAMKVKDESSPYAEKNAVIKDFFDSRDGNQPGKPEQIAAVLWEAAHSPEPPLHMIFGDVALKMWEDRKQQFHDPKWFSTFPHEKYSL